MDKLIQFLTAEERDFARQKFKGKEAGKAWKHTQHLQKITSAKVLIILMIFASWRLVITNYLFHDYWSTEMFVERAVLCFAFVISALLFNKFRILSVTLGVLGMLVILFTYYISGTTTLKSYASNLAILLVIVSSLYFDVKAQKLRKELEPYVVHNHLTQEI